MLRTPPCFRLSKASATSIGNCVRDRKWCEPFFLDTKNDVIFKNQDGNVLQDFLLDPKASYLRMKLSHIFQSIRNVSYS